MRALPDGLNLAQLDLGIAADQWDAQVKRGSRDDAVGHFGGGYSEDIASRRAAR